MPRVPFAAVLALLAVPMLGCPPGPSDDDDDSAADDDDLVADDDDSAVSCDGDFFSVQIGDCTHIGGSLFLYGDAALTHVDELSALTTIGGALQLYGNGALESIEGLSGLTSVAGGSNIYANPVLCQSLAVALIDACPDCGIVAYANDDGC